MKKEINEEKCRDCVTMRPAADVEETPAGVEIVFEMPGVKGEDVAIEAGSGMLTVEGKSTLRRRGAPVMFKRSFYISDAVDVEKIAAKAENGILTLTLPKLESAMPRKIKVS